MSNCSFLDSCKCCIICNRYKTCNDFSSFMVMVHDILNFTYGTYNIVTDSNKQKASEERFRNELPLRVSHSRAGKLQKALSPIASM